MRYDRSGHGRDSRLLLHAKRPRERISSFVDECPPLGADHDGTCPDVRNWGRLVTLCCAHVSRHPLVVAYKALLIVSFLPCYIFSSRTWYRLGLPRRCRRSLVLALAVTRD